MINPLAITSDGYLNSSVKKVLTIAVAGYLFFSPTVIPPISSGGGGGSVQYYRDMPSARSRTWDAIEQVQNREKILREDEELMIIMKVIAICL